MLPIEKIISKQRNVDSDQSDAGPRVVYVAPMSLELPDDGILTYVQIAGVYEMKDVPDRAVCMFAESELNVLKCIVENQSLFDVELINMIGVPKSEYGPMYDEMVWKLDRVGYVSFVSELALAIEARANVDAANETQHDKERATYVRASGTVKQHNALVLPSDSASPEDDSELED